MNFDGKKILITGGTGFLGRHLTRHLLDKCNASYIRIFSRDEHKQDAMRKEFKCDKLRFILGDIRKKETINRAMNDVNIVINCAALKMINYLEYSPMESVYTNIMGTHNVIESAIDNGVNLTVGISSDKCVQAQNIYGSCKAVSERLLIRGNAYAGKDGSKFSVCRYGNVFNSTSSVVPIFQAQKKNGVLTVTDPTMTRFILTIDDAIEIIMFTLEKMGGGEVFIKKAPSAGIMEIASAICNECKIKIIGMRPGEKKHEVLLTEEEALRTISFNDNFILLPYPKLWEDYKWEYPDSNNPKITEEYNSLNNPIRLSVDEIRRLL